MCLWSCRLVCGVQHSSSGHLDGVTYVPSVPTQERRDSRVQREPRVRNRNRKKRRAARQRCVSALAPKHFRTRRATLTLYAHGLALAVTLPSHCRLVSLWSFRWFAFGVLAFVVSLLAAPTLACHTRRSSSVGFRQQTFFPTTRRSFLELASIFQSRPRLRLALPGVYTLSALPPSLSTVHPAAASSPRLPRTIPAADLVAALSHDYEGPVRRGFASDACICVPAETIAWEHERALGVSITDRLETDFPHFGRDETARANVGRAETAVPAPRARVPRECTRLHVRDAGQSRALAFSGLGPGQWTLGPHHAREEKPAERDELTLAVILRVYAD